MNFMEASKSSGRLFIRPICVCYLWTRSELLRDPDRLRVLSLKKNRDVPAVCIIVAVLLDSMSGQVSSLQRKDIAATLHLPFYRLYRVKYNSSIEQRIYSLPFVVTSITNVI